MTTEELNTSRLDKNKIPKHIAIIMDGNGRWAKKRGLPRIAGHWVGAEALRDIVEFCSEIGLEALSVFAFSTENWKRSEYEVSTIFNLLLYYFKKEVEELHKNNIRIKVSGRWEELPDRIVNEIKKSIARTENNTGLILNIVLNYGARNEIIEACKHICRDFKNGLIKEDDIDETMFGSYLYTRGLPDPDLLIRPSGELRVSNFLLWQIAYSELWFTDTYWPDFKPKDLLNALADYQSRERRFGGLK
ncbi:MAG: isoprenyl transferase [Thermoanaerobacterales bacterium]|nr:isoprenyl transferase [Thermoanaerobacterales bacterium]